LTFPTVCALAVRPHFLYGPPPTDIYPLSLHDALPIWDRTNRGRHGAPRRCSPCGTFQALITDVPLSALSQHAVPAHGHRAHAAGDRKSTRLNSSHVKISYAVFCLKKKIIIRRAPDVNV